MQPGCTRIGDDVGPIRVPKVEHPNATFGELLRLRNRRHCPRNFPAFFPAFAKRWGLKSARVTIPYREETPYIAGITSPNLLNKGLPETLEKDAAPDWGRFFCFASDHREEDARAGRLAAARRTRHYA